MSGHASKQIDIKTLWGGKMSPFSTSYGKLMMWFFLVSDALTFSGFLVSYGFARHASVEMAWPIGEETFHSLPFSDGNFPLIYVALMTFILIVSSVTMVLAVEAGHRMDRKGVTKWMIATIVGGAFFVGSQAWEWSHFIHGSKFGRVELADGSLAMVQAEEWGAIKNFKVISIPADTHHAHYEIGEEITDDLLHEYQHAAADGHIHGNIITLHDGTKAEINKAPNVGMELVIKQNGKEHFIGDRIHGEEASNMYTEVVNSGERGRIIYGANLQENEYGPQSYAQFFFFITGFHGFHVFSGVLFNIIILLGVLRGVYHKRGHYEMIEKTGLYWHFVDLVWVFVFTFFYLV